MSLREEIEARISHKQLDWQECRRKIEELEKDRAQYAAALDELNWVLSKLPPDEEAEPAPFIKLPDRSTKRFIRGEVLDHFAQSPGVIFTAKQLGELLQASVGSVEKAIAYGLKHDTIVAQSGGGYRWSRPTDVAEPAPLSEAAE